MKFKLLDNLTAYANKNGTRILLSVLVVYTFFILGRSVISNYQLQRQTDVIKTEINRAQVQNKNLENLILYYQSASFQEVEARRELGLKKPGEKIYIVSSLNTDNFNSELDSQVKNVSSSSVDETANNSNTSNPSLWWQFIFNR